MELGPLGIFSIELHPPEPAGTTGDADLHRAAAGELEALGFSALWVPGGPAGGRVLDIVAGLLDATEHLVLGTEILTVWTLTPTDVAAACAAMEAGHPGRFILGLGASHSNLVEARGQRYEKPLTVMREYLAALDTAPVPVPVEHRMLAALGPRMLELARDESAGSLPYMVSPEHTAFAREMLGAHSILAPEQAVVFDTDPARARALGRRHIGRYLQWANYVNNFRRMGFTDDDFADGGSDRLIDAIVVWGDVDAVEQRVRAHFDAGADHVALQVLKPRGPGDAPGRLPLDEWRRLADLNSVEFGPA